MAGNGELPVTQKQWMTDYWLDEMGVNPQRAAAFAGTEEGYLIALLDYQRYLDAFEEKSQPPATVEP